MGRRWAYLPDVPFRDADMLRALLPALTASAAEAVAGHDAIRLFPPTAGTLERPHPQHPEVAVDLDVAALLAGAARRLAANPDLAGRPGASPEPWTRIVHALEHA